MLLNLVITMMDRNMRDPMDEIITKTNVPMYITALGSGTATAELLSINGLQATEKIIFFTVADDEKSHQLLKAAKEKLYIDVPGNGIMLSIPIKSIGGGKTMAYLTQQQNPAQGTVPSSFPYELIYVILNSGCSDDVMAAARAAGATGGTVLPAKGTGILPSEKFLGISLTAEKEVLLIVAKSEIKSAIMQSIVEKAGPATDSEAICFSLPVSHVAGLRRLDEE